MKKLAKHLIKQAFTGDYTINGHIEFVHLTYHNRDKSLTAQTNLVGFKLEYTWRF